MKISFSIFLFFLPLWLLAQQPGGGNDALLERLREGLVKLHGAGKMEDEAAMLQATLELGELYEQQLYFPKAINYFQQAAALANRLGQHDLRLAVQSRMADALFEDGQLEAAHEAFLEVYEQHQIFRQYKAAIHDLEHLAEAAMNLSRFEEAEENYQTIRDLAVANDDLQTAITATNNLGFVASRVEDFQTAIGHFMEAENAAAHNKIELPAHVLTNLGIAWHNMGDSERSLPNLLKAEGLQTKDKSYIQHLISSIYLSNKDFYNALKFNELAIETAKSSGDMKVLSDACQVASVIYEKLYEYDKALEVYKGHLSIDDSLQRAERRQQENLLELHNALDRAENELRQNLIETELEQVTIEQLELAATTAVLEADKQRLLSDQQRQQLALLQREQEVKEVSLRASQLEADRTRQALQLATQQLLAVEQGREINDLTQQARLDSLHAARQAAEQQQTIALLETEQELARMQAEQTETFRRNIGIAALLVGLIFLLIMGGLLYSRRLNSRLKTQNERIEKQNEEIEAERNRAESLLLNILPQSVADELKINGVATPKHYDAVTVLFTDFQGFTRIAATMPPSEVVMELNECFLKFDEIAERHNLEKIKTMGDAYMCAGGLPEPNNTHFLDAVNAAQEIIAFIGERNGRLMATGRATWPIRIGIHTGELVAGVVGKKKFAYDIWGDTVNVASRMETNSEPMHINISEATYNLVKGSFDCQYRGEVEVKNKGKMGMYLVQ